MFVEQKKNVLEVEYGLTECTGSGIWAYLIYWKLNVGLLNVLEMEYGLTECTGSGIWAY